MKASLRIGIVADDLTGAADSGVQFAKVRWRTYVFSPHAWINESDIGEVQRKFAEVPVLVINTQSRNITRKESYRRVRIAFTLLRDRDLLFKKVDSCLRGNIGAEVDAALDATGGREAIFAAAYPAYGRTTKGGLHYLKDRELVSTEVSQDPKSPVCNSRVVQIISCQSRRTIAQIDNLGLANVLDRLAALMEERFQAGTSILSCDAQTDRDLEALVRVAISREKPPLLVGSAGLAAQVARLLPIVEKRLHTEEGRRTLGRTVWVISGSMSSRTAEQLHYLEALPNTLRVFCASEDLCHGYHHALRAAIAALGLPGLSFEDIRFIILTSRQDIAGRRELAAASRRFGMFGRLVCELLRRYRKEIAGVVLTGGETAEMILRNLRSRGLWLFHELQPGIPFGVVEGGELEATPIVTKAGAFGKEDTLVVCAQHLHKCHGEILRL